MQSRRVRAGFVLLLAIVALGAAGAAVDTTGSGSGSSGLGEGSSSGTGDGGSRPLGDIMEPIEPLFPGEIIPIVIGLLAVGGMVAGVVAVVLAIVNRDWELLLAFVRSAAPWVAMFAALVVMAFFVQELIGSSSSGGSPDPFGGQAEGLSETASETGVSIPPMVAVGIVVVVVLLLLLVARSAADDDDDSPAQVSPDLSDAASGSGGAASPAADVGRPPADNEVYRAWLSLADAAGANARRDTPEEVADRAVESGIDEEAAREITSLFESVRYGGQEPSEGREQRAVRARSSLAGER